MSLTLSQPERLITKSIPSRERLIFALDVADIEDAKNLVELLGDSVVFYKIGLELWMTGRQYELIDWLVARGKKIFADVKLFDVPNTVASAVKQLRGRGVTFITVHGNDQILAAACREKGEVKILAVTVLTSLDDGDLKALGFTVDSHKLVLSRAKRALEIGCDGVISSGLEAGELRQNLADHFLIIVPGIRPVQNIDDQKRTVDVEDAFKAGADYIVVGRPIRQAENPLLAAQAIQKRIAEFYINSKD